MSMPSRNKREIFVSNPICSKMSGMRCKIASPNKTPVANETKKERVRLRLSWATEKEKTPIREIRLTTKTAMRDSMAVDMNLL
jgi:hypothetical protein